MKLPFGFEITRAAAPTPNKQDTSATVPLIEPASPGYEWKRVITSDPREGFYLAFPSKLLPKQIENIKRAGLGGDQWQIWALEALISDSWPMYRKCAHELKQAVADSRWIVRPFAEEGEEPTAKAQEKAALVRRAMLSFRPDPFTDEKAFSGLVYNLCDAVLLGMSVNELQWHVVNGENLPRAATWVHPRHYTFNRDGRISLLGNSDIGDQLSFNKKVVPIPAEMTQGKFLCYQYMSKSGSSLSGGLVRPLGTWWSYWIYGREWIAVMAQKHGTPFLKGKYVPGALDSTEQAIIEGRLRDAGANNYMLTPNSVEVEVVPAQALSKDNPIATLMRQADEAPQYLLLGQTGTTQSTPGKLGGEDTKADVKRERVQALAGPAAIGGCLTEQFARAVIEANYGNCDECPTIEADFTEVSSPEKQASRWQVLLSTGVPVAKSEFYKENSLTEPKPGDEIILGGMGGGKVTIFEGAKTEQEMFEEDLSRQVEQAEVSMALQGEMAGGGANPQPDKKDSAKATQKRSSKLRQVLAYADDSELAELESAIVKAERASHKNGEASALKAQIIEIAGKRRF